MVLRLTLLNDDGGGLQPYGSENQKSPWKIGDAKLRIRSHRCS